MKKITVFTPTFNRAYILHNLYNSLCNQTNKDFTWVIVDDGSTDDTKRIVAGWINEQRVDIKYIFQANGGKMRAHNTGVKYTNTELFVCVDSDDYLTVDAIDAILTTWNEYNAIESCIAGIVAYKGKDKDTPMQNEFPSNVVLSTLTDLYKRGFQGDTTLVYKTETLKKHLFPEIENEKFITEAYIYHEIDRYCKLILLRKPIIICDYLDDGYTKNRMKLRKNNPKGWSLYYIQEAEYATDLKAYFYNLSYGNCYRFLAGQRPICKINRNFFVNLLSVPCGLYLYIKTKKCFKEEGL